MVATIIAAVEWPETLERERSLSWMPDFGNEASPPALDGTRQYRNSNGGGLWRCAMMGVQLTRRAYVLAWLAMEVRLRGGMVPVDVPCCSWRPSRVSGSGAVLISASGAWAARAISGRVTLTNATEPEPGMYFSDYDAMTYGWRLHRIESVSAVSGSGNDRDITFWPPLRFAVANNHQLEFTAPRCVMRLASSDAMDVELELRKRGNPSAEFVEAY